MTRKAPSEFNSLIKTRKAIPVATAAVAAVSLAGCGMLPTQNAVMTPPSSPEQQVATAGSSHLRRILIRRSTRSIVNGCVWPPSSRPSRPPPPCPPVPP